MSSHIEINGKRYDATTGKAVAEDTTMKPHHHLDGIVAPSSSAPHATSPQAAGHAETAKVSADHTTPHPAGSPKKHHPSLQDVKRPAVKRRPHTPQPARTLMRHAVEKPQAAQRPHLKAQSQAGQVAKQAPLEVVPKLSFLTVDDHRLKHAHVIPKSQLISHYNPAAGAVVPMPARQEPVAAALTPLPTPRNSPRQPKTTAELLQHAVDQATSHQQPAPRVKRPFRHSRRIASVSTLALVSVSLFGFVLYQNMPNLKLDLASSKAGFAASLPANQPAGFSLSNLSANTGQVAMHFHSNSHDSRAYTLTEKPSGWDSATLRDSFVSGASGNKYESVTVAGRTLYIYGQQNITWVNGDVWYLVNSDGALSNQQLINLATSL